MGFFAALILDLGSSSSLALLEFIIFGGELSQTSVVIKLSNCYRNESDFHLFIIHLSINDKFIKRFCMF